jgi:WD40 repeat protein
LLSDAQYLLAEYTVPIRDSALQVYHSGLVGMPDCALRKQQVNLQIASLVTLRETRWTHEKRVLNREPLFTNYTSASFSPNGAWLVSGATDNAVRVWDTVTGLVLYTLAGHKGSVESVSFSFDGLSIVSGSYDQTVRVWDAMSGMLSHQLAGHTGAVNAVAFSSDCSQIVSGSADHDVLV